MFQPVGGGYSLAGRAVTLDTCACGLNPVVGKFWNLTYLLLTAEKTKINKKRLVMVHLKKFDPLGDASKACRDFIR